MMRRDEQQFYTNTRGFTLLELLVVIVIIMVMAGIGIYNVGAMVPQMKVNRAAAEMKDVMNKARALAVRTGRTHTLAFNNTIPEAPGQLVLHDAKNAVWTINSTSNKWKIRTPVDNNTNLYIDGSVIDSPDEFHANGLVSSNENGTDHWYALLQPVYYARVAPDGTIVKNPSWRSPNSAHYYKYDMNTKETTINSADSFNADGTVKESRIDPDAIQIGPRYLLPEGVRFWLPPEVKPYNVGWYVPLRSPLTPFRSLQAASTTTQSTVYASSIKFYTNGNANAFEHSKGSYDGNSWDCPRDGDYFYAAFAGDASDKDGTDYNTAVGFMWRDDPAIRAIIGMQAKNAELGVSSDPQRYW